MMGLFKAAQVHSTYMYKYAKCIHLSTREKEAALLPDGTVKCTHLEA